MFSDVMIEKWAKGAAYIAYHVLGLNNYKCDYTVTVINDPSYEQDGLFSIGDNEIRLNLAKLVPYPVEGMLGRPNDMSEKEALADEDYRHALSICAIVFHEMRHLYQKEAVKIYEVNKMLGGNTLKPFESAAKCELWKKELEGYVLNESENTDLEMDANDFAYYLSNRFPIKLPMQRTNRRLGNMKRKYDKVPIPEFKKHSEA